MCGIIGWIDWQHDLTREGVLIERMAETLMPRGPDQKGSWLSPHAAFAHRRLIVIDPQCGEQPMIYEVDDHTYAITYNGEIYNFRELRRELEQQGHTFQTQSDTEVILHAYVEWGEDVVLHLNGIFAFGLWDENKQQLLLARDHLGVKPLFYAQRDRALFFASEVKALLVHPLVKPEIDTEGLGTIFCLPAVHNPGSAVFRDVHEVRPGNMHIVKREGTRVVRY